MTITDAPRYACDCASPEYHQTGNPRCMVSLLLAALQEHGAELAAVENDTTVVPADQLPHVARIERMRVRGSSPEAQAINDTIDRVVEILGDEQ